MSLATKHTRSTTPGARLISSIKRVVGIDSPVGWSAPRTEVIEPGQRHPTGSEAFAQYVRAGGCRGARAHRLNNQDVLLVADETVRTRDGRETFPLERRVFLFTTPLAYDGYPRGELTGFQFGRRSPKEERDPKAGELDLGFKDGKGTKYRLWTENGRTYLDGGVRRQELFQEQRYEAQDLLSNPKYRFQPLHGTPWFSARLPNHGGHRSDLYVEWNDEIRRPVAFVVGEGYTGEVPVEVSPREVFVRDPVTGDVELRQRGLAVKYATGREKKLLDLDPDDALRHNSRGATHVYFEPSHWVDPELQYRELVKAAWYLDQWNGPGHERVPAVNEVRSGLRSDDEQSAEYAS